MDKITEERIKLLHPFIREKVTNAVNEANSKLTKHSEIRIVQGLRTFAEQDKLFNQKPKVTNAKGGQSIHNYGLAIDFALLIDKKEISWNLVTDWDGDKVSDWMEVVTVFKKYGFKWGGEWKFKDNPHFEYLSDWRALLKKYNAKDFIKGTNYVNI
jgi:peptidoglycan LD-endopeptidase CwlK